MPAPSRSIASLAQTMGLGRKSDTMPNQPKSTTPAPREVKPRPRDTTTGIDARDLSPADYERRLADLGLSPPGIEHRRLAPPIDLEAQRVARRALERAERRATRDHARALEARTAEVIAGAIDARTASPDEVRARMASLGIESVGLAVRDIGRTLDPRADVTAGHKGQAQLAADRAVASHVHRAMQRGERVDARKLSSSELRELLIIRGAAL